MAPPSGQWLRGVVKEVLSGDSVTIAGAVKSGPPPEKRLTLSSLMAPKLVGVVAVVSGCCSAFASGSAAQARAHHSHTPNTHTHTGQARWQHQGRAVRVAEPRAAAQEAHRPSACGLGRGRGEGCAALRKPMRACKLLALLAPACILLTPPMHACTHLKQPRMVLGSAMRALS